MRKAISETCSSPFVSRRDAFSRRTLSNTCWKLVLSSRSFDCSALPLIPMPTRAFAPRTSNSTRSRDNVNTRPPFIWEEIGNSFFTCRGLEGGSPLPAVFHWGETLFPVQLARPEPDPRAFRPVKPVPAFSRRQYTPHENCGDLVFHAHAGCHAGRCLPEKSLLRSGTASGRPRRAVGMQGNADGDGRRSGPLPRCILP